MIVMFLIISLSFNVLGFAVTSFYWNEKPLYLNPGESKEIIAFGIQNMAGNQDAIVTVEQISGFDVAKIIDKSPEYKVPFGSKDNYVNMRITIPNDAKTGQVYSIGASFKEAPKGRVGNVQFSSAMNNDIVVVVGKRIEERITEESKEITPKEEKPSVAKTSEILKDNYYNVAAILVILILVIIIIFYRYESKKQNKMRK